MPPATRSTASAAKATLLFKNIDIPPEGLSRGDYPRPWFIFGSLKIIVFPGEIYYLYRAKTGLSPCRVSPVALLLQERRCLLHLLRIPTPGLCLCDGRLAGGFAACDGCLRNWDNDGGCCGVVA